MSDSSNNAISAVASGQPNKPEQFYFAVEMNDEEPIVTICPVKFFDENKYTDVDEFFDEITDFLEEQGFFPILASSYEHESNDATAESVTQKMIEMGFKQNPEFDKHIAETDVDFGEFRPDSVGTYSNDREFDEDVASSDGERMPRSLPLETDIEQQ